MEIGRRRRRICCPGEEETVNHDLLLGEIRTSLVLWKRVGIHGKLHTEALDYHYKIQVPSSDGHLLREKARRRGIKGHDSEGHQTVEWILKSHILGLISTGTKYILRERERGTDRQPRS